MPVIPTGDIAVRLGGQSYLLARLGAHAALLDRNRDAPMGRERTWHVESKPVTTKRTLREDVRPGDMAGEWVMTWDNFSHGLVPDRSDQTGGIHLGENVEAFTRGRLRPIYSRVTQSHTTAEGADLIAGTFVVFFSGILFVFQGRYVFRYEDGVETQDRDFGAGFAAYDAIVHNNELVVGFGGSTNKLQKRAAGVGGAWTIATDAVFANHFAQVEGRLWRATATNQVSNIGPTDNPFTLASWSAGIAVGDNNVPITDLNDQGEQLVVSKENGLFFGDRAAIFPNVLSHRELHRWRYNGRRTVVRGEDVFYPHRRGLIRYTGGIAEEVGFADDYTGNPADRLPGAEFTALAADGKYLWAATAPSGFPRANPVKVATTTDTGANYTNVTANLIDGDLSTVVNLNSYGSPASWVIVGYSAPFYGVLVEIARQNGNTSAITGAFSSGAGAWTTFPAQAAFTDETDPPVLEGALDLGGTLYEGGFMFWANQGLGAWVAATYDGTSAFWVRLLPGAGLTDATTAISEVRVVTAEPRCHIFRGRPARLGDPTTRSIVWEPYGYVTGTARVTGLLYASAVYPHHRGATLVASAPQVTQFFRIPPAALDSGEMLEAGGGLAIMPANDGGTPELNKQFTRITVKGRTLSADRDVQLAYRLDYGDTFTNAGGIVTASPTTITLTGITGRAIQPRITFNAFTSDQPTEINELEITYRELPTYKNEYQMLLALYDGASLQDGGYLPDAATQLANLEALRGTTVTLIDPLGRSVSVTVFEITEREWIQHDQGYPVLLVELRCVEV